MSDLLAGSSPGLEPVQVAAGRLLEVNNLRVEFRTRDGVAKVIKAPYKDPTAPDEDWTSVDFAPAYPLAQPVTLADIKASDLKTMALVKKSRISVVPVTDAEFTFVAVHEDGSPRELTSPGPELQVRERRHRSRQPKGTISMVPAGRTVP